MRSVPVAALVLASLSRVVCAQPADDAVVRFKSCLQSESAARLECLEKLSRELSSESTPAAVQPNGGDWIVSETTSPVDYSPQIAATISSESTVKDAPSSFSIRCRGQRIELLVSTDGSWRSSNNGELKVAYRINDQPPVEGQWAFAAGRIAIFRGDVTKFLRSLLEVGQLSIRVFDWQGPPHEAAFQMSGLDVVRQKFAPVCKW